MLGRCRWEGVRKGYESVVREGGEWGATAQRRDADGERGGPAGDARNCRGA